jgi:hypothetical protein
MITAGVAEIDPASEIFSVNSVPRWFIFYLQEPEKTGFTTEAQRAQSRKPEVR